MLCTQRSRVPACPPFRTRIVAPASTPAGILIVTSLVSGRLPFPVVAAERVNNSSRCHVRGCVYCIEYIHICRIINKTYMQTKLCINTHTVYIHNTHYTTATIITIPLPLQLPQYSSTS